MGSQKTDDPNSNVDVVPDVYGADTHALENAFHRHRERLKRMVRLRLDPRLQGRVDESDVLQEAYIEASRRVETDFEKASVPMFLWLRGLTIKHLIAAHRRHLGAQKRTTKRDVSLQGHDAPAANTSSMAMQLAGPLTSPSQAAIKAETRRQLQEVLESLSVADRDVLTLRHFEQLTNAETAQVLEIEESAASKRYARALKRLQEALIERGVTG